jgi:hypothetical protein
MSRALLGAFVAAVVVAAGIFALPYANIHIPLPQLLIGAAALSSGVTIGAIVFLGLNRNPVKIGASELTHKRLCDIEGLIRPFPTEKVQALSIRPETFARNIDTIVHPEKYRDRTITLSLRGPSKEGEPFNPVKLREIFDGLRNEPNFDHIVLYDDHKEFIGYIPALYARSAFIDPGAAETYIARAITDIYSGSLRAEDLRRIGGATRMDVIAHNAYVSEAATRMGEGGIRQLVVLQDNYHRKPIGLIYANSLVTLLNKGGTLRTAIGKH